MATKAAVTFKSTKVPGIRKNSRSGKFEPMCTFWLGRFDSIEKATKVRASFIAKVSKLRNGLSPAERKRDEREARKIVADHISNASAAGAQP